MQKGIPAKIVGIQFSLFSPEEIEKSSVVEITNKETYVGLKPKIGGLFDPRMGVLDPGLVCPTDGKNYIHCPGYFGHIKLAKPVFYIQYLETILNIMKCVCIKCGKCLLSKKTHSYLLNQPNQKRWKYIFEQCKNINRCGDENDNGCGCKQPEKIKLNGFATIVASWVRDEDGEFDSSDKDMKLQFTPEMVTQLFKKISDEDINFMGYSNIWSRPEWMVCSILPVAPPPMRPSIKLDAQQRSEDDITHIYINIIKYNNKLKQLLNSSNADEQLNVTAIEGLTQVIQYYIATVVDNKMSGASPLTQRSGRPMKSISERHKGKTGRVRGNLMGKRVDFSARSVITPDPELSIAELGVPMKIAKNITKPVKVQKNNLQYLYYLVKNGPNQYPGAKIIEKKNGVHISLGYIDRENIKLEIGDIVHRHMLDGDYVLFNRQPTLHRMSMMSHVVKVMEHGDSFRMNVADTKPYNADFDGDEMNMHMPQNDEAEAELRYLANVPNQIVSPGNNKPIIGVFQDSLIGSFLFTRKEQKLTKKQIMNLLMKTNCFNTTTLFEDTSKKSYNTFDVISEILPNISLNYKTDLFGKSGDTYDSSNFVLDIQNGKINRGQFDKGVLGGSSKGILHRILKDYNNEKCHHFIDNLQGIITEYMKTTGFSVGISDLIADEDTNDKINSTILEKKKEVSNLIDKIHLGIIENKTGKSNEDYFETEVNNILNAASKDAGNIGIGSLGHDNRFVALVTSGSKGSGLNISQMISCVGQQNVDGKRIPYGYVNRTLPHFKQFDDSPKARGFVQNSYISGLTPDELFFHAIGGRIGLIDTAVKTSTTGYIQRRLIKGMEDIQVMYDKTVRNNKNKIIQFTYGGTSFDTMYIENIRFELFDMNINDIYERYCYNLLNDPGVTQKKKKDYLKLIYNKETLSKFMSQSKLLKTKSYNEIQYLIQRRNDFITKVFLNLNKDNKIYMPIHFTNMIQNIKHRFNINSHSISNITPMDAYTIIERTYSILENMYQPCEKFKIVYTFYMNPFNLIHNHKYHLNALEYLCEKIIYTYQKSIVNPGEMVGMVGAQSIGEPTTQMTLNTFHFAGVSSKSNVTRGVPRIEELLTLTKKLKNPSMTIHLKEDEQFDMKCAHKCGSKIEHTRFIDIIQKAEIYYEPDDKQTLISDDDQLMNEYIEMSDLLRKCYGETESPPQEGVEEESKQENNWIIRIEMNETEMFDMNITNEDIHYNLKLNYGDEILCFYSDYNTNGKIIFRIRPTPLYNKKKLNDTFTQEDHIYYVKSFMEKILNDMIIRGIKDIEKVTLRKIKQYQHYDEKSGNFENKETYVIDTVGTNLLDVLALDFIVTEKTITNDIMEVYEILGIEAARKCLFEEILDVMEFDDTYINHHHIHLLCDRMTCNEKLVSIFRHGINKDNIGPIAKASFEETTEMFLQAAKHGELDNMRGVSANVMCGQEGYYGTSSFQIFVDSDELIEQYKSLPPIPENDKFQASYDDRYKDSTEILREIADKQNTEFGGCSIQNLKQNNILHEGMIQNVVVEKDNNYEIDI